MQAYLAPVTLPRTLRTCSDRVQVPESWKVENSYMQVRPTDELNIVKWQQIAHIKR